MVLKILVYVRVGLMLIGIAAINSGLVQIYVQSGGTRTIELNLLLAGIGAFIVLRRWVTIQRQYEERRRKDESRTNTK